MDKKYILCPNCGKKLFKVDKDSVYNNIYIWCKCCRKEIHIKEPKSRTK